MIYYYNHDEENVPVKQSLPNNITILKRHKDKIANLCSDQCSIMLSHDTSTYNFLTIQPNPISANTEKIKVKILIAFSSQGAKISPKVFTYGHNGENFLIYGFGIHRAIQKDSYKPKPEELNQLLNWAVALYSQIKDSGQVDMLQIVDDLPAEVRRLLTPASYPESLLAAYLLLIAKSKGVDLRTDAIGENIWDEAGKEYKDGGVMTADINWAQYRTWSPEEQNCITAQIKDHFYRLTDRDRW